MRYKYHTYLINANSSNQLSRLLEDFLNELEEKTKDYEIVSINSYTSFTRNITYSSNHFEPKTTHTTHVVYRELINKEDKTEKS